MFERPIQVGDTVDINGIWGTVIKINVRSTVVETYDSASIIIPNSEFISNKLVNWSFNNLKCRRKINIGVSYSSDVNLVKKTLLDIANKNVYVYKKPQPDVVFIDFGDSALIFTLRFWTHIDKCMIAETDIRMEIINQFRELNIEIPFPQRFVHMAEKTEDTLNSFDDE